MFIKLSDNINKYLNLFLEFIRTSFSIFLILAIILNRL